MSDKVWITAKSEAIPFSELADKHLQNCIEWCDLRIQSLRRAKSDPRTNLTVNKEWARVADLKFDLVMEQKARAAKAECDEAARPKGTWFEIVADKNGTINNTYVPKGQKFRFYLAPGSDLALHP